MEDGPLRFGEARRDHVDRDAVGAHFHGQVLREIEQGGFDGPVGIRAGALLTQDGGEDVDDAAPAPLLHTRQRRLAAMESAFEHHLNLGLVVLLPVHLHEGSALHEPARVVDENFDAAHPFFAFPEHALHLVMPAHVGLDAEGAAASFLNRFRGLLRRRLTCVVVHGDGSAFARQCVGDGFANTARCAGNERSASFEFHAALIQRVNEKTSISATSESNSRLKTLTKNVN